MTDKTTNFADERNNHKTIANMFSGIVETMTRLIDVRKDGGNMIFTFERPADWTLKIDQSIAHNGTCLTVDSIAPDKYTVTAMDETLKRTNLGLLKTGDCVNLERSMKAGSRLDGHIVQGHVDRTAICTDIGNADGSRILTFRYDSDKDDLKKGYAIVEKGSVTINGVSLTAYDIKENSFKVSIIPYTSENTNLGKLETGNVVNLEFDIIGKYIARLFPGMQQ